MAWTGAQTTRPNRGVCKAKRKLQPLMPHQTGFTLPWYIFSLPVSNTPSVLKLSSFHYYKSIHRVLRVWYNIMVTITTVLVYLGQSKWLKIFNSHISGGWKSKIKVPADYSRSLVSHDERPNPWQVDPKIHSLPKATSYPSSWRWGFQHFTYIFFSSWECSNYQSLYLIATICPEWSRSLIDAAQVFQAPTSVLSKKPHCFPMSAFRSQLYLTYTSYPQLLHLILFPNWLPCDHFFFQISPPTAQLMS